MLFEKSEEDSPDPSWVGLCVLIDLFIFLVVRVGLYSECHCLTIFLGSPRVNDGAYK